jgi:uncharacterized protein (TIGR01732 family)
MGYNNVGGSYGCNGGNVGGSYDCNNVGGYGDRNNNKEFVLIVVLFILLIIVGAHFMKKDYC